MEGEGGGGGGRSVASEGSLEWYGQPSEVQLTWGRGSAGYNQNLELGTQ